MLLISWDNCRELQKENNFSKCEKCLERFECWTSRDNIISAFGVSTEELADARVFPADVVKSKILTFKKCQESHTDFVGCEDCESRFLCWTGREVCGVFEVEWQEFEERLLELSKVMRSTGISIAEWTEMLEKKG